MRVWSQTGHANKSLKHIGVVDYGLAGRYRKRYSKILASDLGQIDAGKVGVEVELQSSEASCLTAVEPSMRLGISKAELQLETCPIAVDYVFSSHVLICAKVDLPLVCGVSIRIPDGHLDEALKTSGISLQSQKTPFVHVLPQLRHQTRNVQTRVSCSLL